MSAALLRALAAAVLLPQFAAGAGNANLQALIDAVPAGGRLELGPGIHAGPVRIGKSITLAGGGVAVIDGGRAGPVIVVDAPDVRLEGLVVRNSGLRLEDDDAGILVRADGAVLVGNRVESCLHGIYFRKVGGGEIRGNSVTGPTGAAEAAADPLRGGVQVDRGDELCAVGSLDVNRRGNGIHLWNSRGILITGNVVARTRDGIYFSFSDDCVVLENLVTGCRYGLHYMYSDGNRFARNRFSHNAAGAALMYSGRLDVADNEFSGSRGRRAYGALLQSVDGSVFTGNRFAGNTVGLYSENSQDNRLLGNVLENNYIALRLGGSSRGNAHSLNRFARNVHTVESSGAGADNRWSQGGRGNRWGGAGLPDLDGDGVGEFAHRESDLLGRLRQRFPLAGLLSGSPGLELIRFANERSPIPGVPAIVDPHPLAASHD